MLVQITPAALRKNLFHATQSEMASLIGVSARTLARWEAGKATKPGLRTLSILAQGRGAPVILRNGELLVEVRPVIQTATAPGPADPGAPALVDGQPPLETTGCQT